MIKVVGEQLVFYRFPFLKKYDGPSAVETIEIEDTCVGQNSVLSADHNVDTYKNIIEGHYGNFSIYNPKYNRCKIHVLSFMDFLTIGQK